MKEIIDYLDWYQTIGKGNVSTVHALGSDFVLLDEPIIPKEFYQNPFKLNVVIGIICIKGSIQGIANLKPYKLEAPCLFIVMPEMVLEFEQLSSDFEGRFVILSKSFLSNMRVDNSGDILVNVLKRPCIPLSKEELDSIMLYYEMVKVFVIRKDNPYQTKIICLLTMAFFYGAGYYIFKLEQNEEKSKNEILFTQFMNLIQIHFAQQKSIEFYADKLNLSPKYMSTQIKQVSGKSAGEWIDNRIMLESKALLKSSDLTIQQIADRLNFPDQSAFGKFFKRQIGISPKSYRGKS